MVLLVAQSRRVEMPNHRYWCPPTSPVAAPTNRMSPERSDRLVQQLERIVTVHWGWGGLSVPRFRTEANDVYASEPVPWSNPLPVRLISPTSAEAVVFDTGFAAAYAGTR